jgi:biotin carboxyl carrier protein
LKPDIVETEPGVYSILADGASYELRLSADEVFVNGRRFALETNSGWKRRGSGGGGEGRANIVAPMPGKVVRVLAELNQEVQAGQGIVVVEAMKMQNEMKAPQAGRVASISVKTGDSVNAGAVLATIEQPGARAER